MFSEGRERVRALGLFTAVSVGGGAVGLIIGGMLTEWASWRWVMFVNVPIGLAVIVVGLAVLPETERHRGTFDLRRRAVLHPRHGRSWSTASSGPPPTAGPTRSRCPPSSPGVVLLTAFVLTELRAEQPDHPAAAVQRPQPHDRQRGPRRCCSAGMFGLFFFLTQFLQDVLGYSALTTGFAFLPLPVTVFLSRS